MMPIRVAQRRLAALWFTFTGVLALLLVLQSSLGKYGDKANEAWNWFLPIVVPTSSVIVAAFAVELRGEHEDGRRVSRFLYRLTLAFVAAYLGTVALTFLLQPLADWTTPLGFLRASNWWLGPFQGLVAGLLTAVFTTRKSEAPAATPAAP